MIDPLSGFLWIVARHLIVISMPFSFWIAAGTSVAILLLSLLRSVRRREIQVLTKLVDPDGIPRALSSKDQQEKNKRLIPQGEKMNASTPTPTPTSRPSGGVELRRSSRVQMPVPLLILGTDCRGETFQERTSAVAVNLHGCRYPSRHEYAQDGWITLQITGTEGRASRPVRARVRSVFSGQSSRELCQVGVELATPANVWGISAPPEDWQRLLAASTPSPGIATGVAPALETAPPVPALQEEQALPAERKAEVTIFPGQALSAAAVAETAPAKESAPAKTDQFVITSEQVLQTLKGQIRLAADKAVQGSLSAQLDQAVKFALAKIEERREANVRQLEQFSIGRMTEMQDLSEKHLIAYRGQAQEISSGLHALAESSRQTLAETPMSVERLGELHKDFEQRHDLVLHRLDELARQLESLGAETSQARSQQEQDLAGVRSFLANANAGVTQEHLESRLNSSREHILSVLEWRLGEVSAHYEKLLGEVRNNNDRLAEQVEKLSNETRDHLAEARSRAERGPRDVQPQEPSLVEQSLSHATQEFETAAARVSDREFTRLMEQKQALSREVSLELEARTSEARALLQRSANSTLEEFRRSVELQIDLILAEAKERVTSSIALLDAESRSAIEARRRALEIDVARAAEQSTAEFRSGIKAFLYSCLVAAVGAVDQHAQTTLAGLTPDPGGMPRRVDAAGSSFPKPGEPPAQPDDFSPPQR